MHGAELRGSVRAVATPDELTKEQTAAIVRAAIAYSGQELKSIEKMTGVKSATIRNYTSGRTRAKLEQRLRIGTPLGVPAWFMASGFAGAVSAESDVGALQAELADLRVRMEARLLILEGAIRRQSAGTSQPTRVPRRQPRP